ncbi:hypothetical protein Tco_1007407, partial [Tanacetum coccineum]
KKSGKGKRPGKGAFNFAGCVEERCAQYEFCVAAPVPAADGTIAASEWELKS